MSFARETVLGDLLHHAGELVDVRTAPDGTVTENRWLFTGYAKLKQEAADRGLQVTENPDGSISIQTTDPDPAAKHDLWATGTNLLNFGGLRPGGNITTPLQLDNHSPTPFDIGAPGAPPRIAPVVERLALSTYTWNLLGELAPDNTVSLLDTLGSIGLTRHSVSQLGLDEDEWGATLKIHQHTLAEVLGFNLWTARRYPNADTPFGQYLERDAVLSGNGLVVVFSLRVPLIYPLQDLFTPVLSNAVFDGTLGEAWTIDEQDLALRNQRAIAFDDYGWPAGGADQQAFLGPRRERLYAAMTLESQNPIGQRTWLHPNVSNEPSGPDGADWQIANLPQEKDKPGIRVIVSLALAPPADDVVTWPNQFQVYRNPDVLWEFASQLGEAGFGDWYAANRDRLLANSQSADSNGRMVWLSLLREHYNAIANAVNAITKCRPFTFLNFRIPFQGDTRKVQPNQAGICSGNTRPANHWATVVPNSDDYLFYESLGLPILTDADFPASYRSFLADPDQTLSSVLTASLTYKRIGNGQDRSGFHWADYDCTATFGPLSFRRITTPPTADGKANDVVNMFGAVPATPVSDFRWISVDDLKAKAEELGFLFFFERVAAPYALKRWERGGAKQMFTSGAAVQREVRRITVRSPTLSPIIPDNTVSITLRGDFTVPGREWLLTEAVTEAEVEWIREEPWSGYQVAPDYHPGDVDSYLFPASTNWNVFVEITSVAGDFPFLFGLTYGLEFPIDERWRRQQDGILRRARADIIPENFFFGAGVVLQTWASDGLEVNSKAVLIPIPIIEHTVTNFSEAGMRETVGRITYGARVIPLRVADPPLP